MNSEKMQAKSFSFEAASKIACAGLELTPRPFAGSSAEIIGFFTLQHSGKEERYEEFRSLGKMGIPSTRADWE